MPPLAHDSFVFIVSHCCASPEKETVLSACSLCSAVSSFACVLREDACVACRGGFRRRHIPILVVGLSPEEAKRGDA